MIHGLLKELRAQDESAASAVRDLVGSRPDPVQVSSRWAGRNVWALFSGQRGYPEVIVKADHHERYKVRLRREHETLLALERRSDLTGIVPRALALTESGSRLALFQTGLPGRSLSVRIRQRLRPTSRASRRDQDRILAWLARLQLGGQNGQPGVLHGKQVLGRVARLLEDSHPGFLDHLEHLASAWAGLRIPWVDGHGDLGPTNCLLHRGVVGIIDWEGGLGRRNPLTDVVVFLNHYGRLHAPAGDRRTRWDSSFRRVFLSDDWLATVSTESFVRHLERLGIPVAAGEYLLIATLAELAAGEGRIAQDGAVSKYWRPFFQMYAGEFEASSIRRAVGV